MLGSQHRFGIIRLSSAGSTLAPDFGESEHGNKPGQAVYPRGDS
jgi:hypothetical protein